MFKVPLLSNVAVTPPLLVLEVIVAVPLFTKEASEEVVLMFPAVSVASA